METYPASPIPSFSQVITGEYKTLISQFDSGAEQRRRLLRFPKRTVNINYKTLTVTETETLRAFFRKVFGSSESFWWVDPIKKKWTDEYLGRGIFYSLLGAVADDGGAQTDQTTAANNATANDMTLLPASPVTNDCYYFGHSASFDVLRLNVGTAGAGTYTIAWSYWSAASGGSWASLSNVTDGTNGFKNAGTNDVKFDQVSNWQLKSIQGITGYWIRALVTMGTCTTQPKGTQAWAAARYFDLHGVTNTQGDLAVYVNGVLKTGGGTDYTYISGGGDAGADRIKFVNPLVSGDLATCDLNAYLRLKSRLLSDTMKEEMISPNIYTSGLSIFEVQW
jgi:hypothetical protein